MILCSGEKNGKGEIDKYAGFGKMIKKERFYNILMGCMIRSET